MARLYLIRHGQAAAAWGAAADPGLSELGHVQASEIAKALSPTGPLPLVTSPLRRARETARAFELSWAKPAAIESAIGEIPTPDAIDLTARGPWLKRLMTQSWSGQEASLQLWRAGIIDLLRETARDTVFVSHFVVINVAFGIATGADSVLNFHPDYCSCTEIENDGGKLKLVRRGSEGETRIL